MGLRIRSLVVVGLALGVTPSIALGAGSGVAAPATDKPPDGQYDLERARADLDIIVEGTGRPYLQARARLADHPQRAHEAALEALEALEARVAALEKGGAYDADSPSGTDIERKRGRLIAVLAEARDPKDAPRFAQRLRAVLRRPEAQEDWRVLLEPWRGLLIGLGPQAAPQFAAFVADTSLDPAQREFFLQDLVAVSAAEALPALCAQLGQGDRALERSLRRALVKRARSDEASAQSLLLSLERIVSDSSSEPSKRAAAILVRQSIAGLNGEAETQLVQLASEDTNAFDVRAAALLVLAQEPAARMTVEALAVEHLDPAHRSGQSSELLAWLALRSLPEARRAQLDARFDLRNARSPRLAAVGWQSAKLDAKAEWIAAALRHPWPEVQLEGLSRVSKGCSHAARNRLRLVSGPQSAGGFADEQLSRAALGALGRCADFEGLRKLVQNEGIGFERRGAAARALVEHDPQGAVFVAREMGNKIDPHLGDQFAQALGHTPSQALTPAVVEALCKAEATNPAAANSAMRSRRRVAPDAPCPER